MSRYSPTVTPDAGPDWGSKIVDAARLAYELKRQAGEDRETQLDREIRRQAAGVRTGTAPVESPTTVTVADVPTFTAPDPAALGRVLAGGSLDRPSLNSPPPFAAPGDHEWRRGLASGGTMVEEGGITGLPPGSGHVFGDGSDLGRPDFRAPSSGDLAAALHESSRSMPQRGPQGALAAPAPVHDPAPAFPIDYPGQDGEQEQMPLRNRAQTHPGAFDPASRSFGGSPLQQAIAAQHAGATPLSPIASPGRTVTLPNSNPRYQQLDEGHYVDNLATPEAQREREMRAQAEFQRELRGEDRLDAASAAAADRQRKAIAYIAAGVEPGRAVLYAENPALAANDPRLGKATAPIMGSPEWLAAQQKLAQLKLQYRPPPQNTYTAFQGTDETGKPVVRPFNTKTGQFGPVADVAPKVTGAGGAQAAKARSYADLMDQAMPTLESLSEKVRPTRISFAVAHPTVGNYGLNQDEQLYMEAARNFLAGALHLESGARLSKEQWAIGVQRFFPTAGDTPETKAFKLEAARRVAADRRREAGGSTPAAGGAPGAATPPAAGADPFADLIPRGAKPPDLE